MGYACVVGPCAGCDAVITYNPHHVPSLPVNGVREPICRSCHGVWNEIHRTSKGLDPLPIHPDAYEPLDEREL